MISMKLSYLNPFPEVKLYPLYSISDHRGDFLKIFNDKSPVVPRDVYVSRSLSGVFRGLHYQTGGWEQAKFVIPLEGEIIDVFIDCREGSPKKGAVGMLKLEPWSHGLLVPRGFAHGFFSVTESLVLNIADNDYAPEFEKVLSPLEVPELEHLKITGLSDKDKG